MLNEVLIGYAGHLMENINRGVALHRAFRQAL
jgi:hypothetical protein